MTQAADFGSSSLLVSILALAVLAGACVSPGPGPGAGPGGGARPGFRIRAGQGGRVLRYTDAIKQISLRAGRLGWGGLEVGMSFHDAELVVRKRLPSLAGAPRDELCGYYNLDAEVLGQRLRLEVDGEAREGRLKAIWLPLASPAGELSTLDVVRALKARFPNLRYLPSPHEPDLAESANPRPLFQVTPVEMIFVVPREGLYFGEICVD